MSHLAIVCNFLASHHVNEGVFHVDMPIVNDDIATVVVLQVVDGAVPKLLTYGVRQPLQNKRNKRPVTLD